MYRRGQDDATMLAFTSDEKALLLEWHFETEGMHVLDSAELIHSAYSQNDEQLAHSHTLARKENQTTIWVCVYYPKTTDVKLPPMASTMALHFGHLALHSHVRLLKGICWVCGTQTTKLCRRCRRAVYCTKDCFRMAWPSHAPLCNPPTLHTNVRLGGKDLYKNRRINWDTSKKEGGVGRGRRKQERA